MITYLFALTIAVSPIQDDPLISHDFETGTYGWTLLTEGHNLTQTTNSLDVKNGKSSLAFTYVPSEGQIPGVALEVGDLTGAGGITFWIKSARNTTLLVGFNEKEGERFNIAVSIEADSWFQVRANFEDFILADDSAIQNRKVDVQDAASFMIVDVLALFGSNEIGAILFGSREGTNALWLDDFKVHSKPPMPKRFSQKFVIDSFERDYVSWIPLRGISLNIVRFKGMTVKYRREMGRFYGMFRPVAVGSLSGATEIVFRLTCPQEIAFVSHVEESDGEKWQLDFAAHGGNESSEFVTSLSEYRKTDDSGMADDVLDPAMIKTVALIDATQGAMDTDNEFLIERVFAK